VFTLAPIAHSVTACDTYRRAPWHVTDRDHLWRFGSVPSRCLGPGSGAPLNSADVCPARPTVRRTSGPGICDVATSTQVSAMSAAAGPRAAPCQSISRGPALVRMTLPGCRSVCSRGPQPAQRRHGVHHAVQSHQQPGMAVQGPGTAGDILEHRRPDGMLHDDVGAGYVEDLRNRHPLPRVASPGSTRRSDGAFILPCRTQRRTR
jgi:hypothetical protein